MGYRLVLGYGTIGRQVVERLTSRDGPDDLLVITGEDGRVETLRDENIRARAADPTDPTTLEAIEEPDTVFVGGDRTDINRATLEIARKCFSSASIVAYVGADPKPADRARFGELADHVVDSDDAIVDHVVANSVGATVEATLGLGHRLDAIEGQLAVVAHDNPDPDAIASAVALADIAEFFGVDAEACYYGSISHQENKAMVNLLDLELRNLEPDESLEEFSAFALVDHSRPGVNDGLPESLCVDIVIDHHPPRGPVPGAFVDLREHAGATSTILTEYIERLPLEFDPATATALLYGIHVDTNDFTREVSPVDFQAASVLWKHADSTVLEQIEQPTVDGETLETIARGIKSRIQRDSVVAASVGQLSNRDALPQTADQLLAIDGVDTTLAFGFIDEMAYLSARSRANDIDLGEVLRDAFDRIGSAGGHADMAGAQLEVGILAEIDDAEEIDSIVSVVEEVITNRFFEAIQSQPGVPVGAYTRTSEWLFGSEHGYGKSV